MRDPRAVEFIHWWERNADRYPEALWFDALDYWAEPLKLDAVAMLALFDDCAAEYHERAWRRRQEQRQAAA